MPGMARPLDHLVMPVADLAKARARLTALGFLVAPDGLHPFGTANCCVYFADGTFLEPLAVAVLARYREALADGNVFVGRDHRFRQAKSADGISALAFTSDDAAADHARFVAAGLSAGPQLEFARPFVEPDGRQGMAGFRLAFAALPEAGDIFAFSCERVRLPQVDREALTRHPNGVIGLTEIVISAAVPARPGALIAAASASEPVAVQDGLSFAPGHGAILVLDSTAAQEASGAAAPAPAEAAVAAIGFRVGSISRLESLLAGAGIPAKRTGPALSVAAAPGQGAAFLFEAER